MVCPDCQKKDEVLSKGLKRLRKVAKRVDIYRGRVCSFCETSIKKKERSLRAEFRHDGSELRVDVCEKCIDEHDDLKAIHIKGPNPIFNVKVNCLSADVCESFKKPGKDRGINCGHVVANMDGELYCRRGHPGNVRVYRERYAFPPSRRQLMKMFTVLGPLFEKFKNGSQLLAEETSVASSLKLLPSRDTPVFSDTVEYELKEFPLDGNNILLPWNAHVIKVEQDAVIAMVPVEKKEEK